MIRFFPLLTVLACGPVIDNPSGDCDAGGDGNRSNYFSSDQYLPDCQNPLYRELWRVFAETEASAYILPRPDGMGIDFAICDGEDADLTTLFTEYGVCEEYADPDVINDIKPADALVITNQLHQRLRFSADENGGLFPWAPDDDILAACTLIENQAALSFCALLESRCSGYACDDIGYIPGPEAVEALIPALNELYGI